MTPGAGAGPGRTRPRVLVVDDDASLLATVGEALEGRGFEVCRARDGDDGLRMWLTERPDLLIADLEMPGVRGRELLRRVRALDPAAAVVLMSGFATRADAVRVMKEGASDFLEKPFRLGRLVELVRRLAGG